MVRLLIAVFLLSIAHVSYCVDKIDQSLVISNVERIVDVTTQIIKIASKLTLTNNGNGPADYFLYSLERGNVDRVSFIGAYTKSKQSKLTVSPTEVSGSTEAIWRIDIPKGLKPAAKIDVDVEILITNSLTPFPSAITQKDKQLVVYDGNANLFSPYSIVKQSTTIVVNTKVVESFTQLKPVQQNSGKIVYGPFENVKPFTVQPISVHYENNAPFLSVTSIERAIEISHWGNIAIEEAITLEHRGAVLKGPFSRVDAQGPATVKWFETVLPAAARDVYYRDDIGNVSTSNLRVLSDSVHVRLQPRFPLFGGWKTKYVLGYNVPTYEALYNSGHNYILKIRILDHIFDDMVVDELVTKIVLPEGAVDITVKTPFPVVRLADERLFTYLDTIGRTVVVLKGSNLVENHIQDLEVAYRYPTQFMLHEPLLLVFGVYTLLVAAILMKRIDLTLSPTGKAHN